MSQPDYHAHKVAGKCTRCTRPASPANNLCPKHARFHREYQRGYMRARRAARRVSP